MPKGYWICSIEVEDADEYAEYIAVNGPIYAKYGGVLLVRGGQYTAVEGSARSRNVVIEFPSYETALACYRSPEYTDAKVHRLNASTGTLVVVEGAS